MKTPKVLPWLARKAGLTDEHVEMLWGSTLRHVNLKQPQLAANQRMAMAMQALVARLGHEKNLRNDALSSVRIVVKNAGRGATTSAPLRA